MTFSQHCRHQNLKPSFSRLLLWWWWISCGDQCADSLRIEYVNSKVTQPKAEKSPRSLLYVYYAPPAAPQPNQITDNPLLLSVVLLMCFWFRFWADVERTLVGFMGEWRFFCLSAFVLNQSVYRFLRKILHQTINCLIIIPMTTVFVLLEIESRRAPSIRCEKQTQNLFQFDFPQIVEMMQIKAKLPSVARNKLNRSQARPNWSNTNRMSNVK